MIKISEKKRISFGKKICETQRLRDECHPVCTLRYKFQVNYKNKRNIDNNNDDLQIN